MPFHIALLDRAQVAESPSQRIVPLLPATYRDHHAIRSVGTDIHGFLNAELHVLRLNRVHRWLWLVGLPSNPRSLHYQIVKRREIVVTYSLDLHLVWSSSSSSTIYVKPLPRYLLCPDFWRKYICPSPHLYEVALGFLLTYVALVERESDYKLAIDHRLLPKEITWSERIALVEEIVCATSQAKSYLIDASPSTSMASLAYRMPVNKRFYFGELRLGRLNWIYRVALLQPRGYLSGDTTYSAFVRDNVNSLITLFLYTTIVLPAMQVGLTTPFLANDYSFGMASYVFSFFSMVAPLAGIVGILGIIAIMFVINLLRTISIRSMKRGQGADV